VETKRESGDYWPPIGRDLQRRIVRALREAAVSTAREQSRQMLREQIARLEEALCIAISQAGGRIVIDDDARDGIRNATLIHEYANDSEILSLQIRGKR